MTSSRRFESLRGGAGRTSGGGGKAAADDSCGKCGGPLASRQAHPFPVLEQVAFALSFVAFLLFFDKVRDHKPVVWAWSGVQVALGALLIRGRLRARKRVLRCIRCDTDLR